MMRTLRLGAAMAGSLLLALTALCGCKGRTAENMEPTGDTVEVEIHPVVDSVPLMAAPEAEMP